MPAALVLHDPQLLVLVGIAERGAQEEAVELRLGQRERALLLDRVLGRDRKNGAGSGRVSPSTVTCRSAIASSSADCVFGIARLISSTSRTFANTGPGRNSNSRSRGSQIESPVTSVGCRSGVHWMRLDARAVDRAGERPRQHRLGRARDVLEQHVPATRERGDDDADLLALADHDRLDVLHETIDDRDGAGETSAVADVRVSGGWFLHEGQR